MAYFHTKNTNLGLFWRDLEFIMLIYILHGRMENCPSFGIFFTIVYLSFVVISCIFGKLYEEKEKSGNPAVPFPRMKRLIPHFIRLPLFRRKTASTDND